MDNIRSHHVKKVSEIINHSGKHLTLLYLPAYSPDLNPIEMMWSKIKSILRILRGCLKTKYCTKPKKYCII